MTTVVTTTATVAESWGVHTQTWGVLPLFREKQLSTGQVTEHFEPGVERGIQSCLADS